MTPSQTPTLRRGTPWLVLLLSFLLLQKFGVVRILVGFSVLFLFYFVLELVSFFLLFVLLSLTLVPDEKAVKEFCTKTPHF